MKRKILYALAVAILMTGTVSRAEPLRKTMPEASELVPVPENMQQRWILKNCEKGKLAYRFSEHFLILSTKVGSRLLRIGGLQDNGGGHYSMTRPGETAGLVLNSKGDLIQYFGDTQANFSVQALEKKEISIPFITFKSCPDEPTLIQEDPAYVSLLPGLDKIHKACPDAHDIFKAGCQKAVFTLFDTDGDESLDEKEMTRAWDMILPKSSFTACGPLAGKADELLADGKAYFAWMLTHLDKNADKKIAFDEIEGQWKNMQGDPLMSGATNILIAAEAPLEILPDDIQMTCTNCCIAIRGPD